MSYQDLLLGEINKKNAIICRALPSRYQKKRGIFHEFGTYVPMDLW